MVTSMAEKNFTKTTKKSFITIFEKKLHKELKKSFPAFRFVVRKFLKPNGELSKTKVWKILGVNYQQKNDT